MTDQATLINIERRLARIEELLLHLDNAGSEQKDSGEFLTVQEAATEAKMNYHSFRRMVVDRKLVKHSRPCGPKGNILIKRCDLIAFLEAKKKPGRPGRKASGIKII
ncbi:MerR family transcriptional regulator [Desulfogranum japonicum]|uniref:helix-turn-helix domain-containing protein n=1 Tax=Desulfogranum japonicum TaxID=231447 RepID=UPI0004116064|nr:helix-turn-helix domain-containing protein [Desulfogranum japonicum]